MCVIIDANVAHVLLGRGPDGQPIHDHIQTGKVSIVSGGLNARELSAAGLGRWLVQLVRSGTAAIFEQREIEHECKSLHQLGLCISNDLHIVALARLSGARLLFTRDRQLQADFKNYRIISHPRGRIYSSRRNIQLLENSAEYCKRMPR
jgi:hypothetical protein